MKRLIIILLAMLPSVLLANTKPTVFSIYDYYAHKHHAEVAMVYGIAEVESEHRPGVKNKRSGATGLMQLMPKTATWYCKVKREDLILPQTNVDCGVRYFVYLKKMFGGSDTLALAAYHSGPTTVNDFRYGTNKSGRNPEHLKTGIPPWDVSYVRKVYRARAKYL